MKRSGSVKMKEFWHKAFFHLKTKPGRQKGKRKSKGQSLVEVALAFPFLLMLLSGMVEFGFMLNYYVSLTDSTRETARIFSNFDPFNKDGSDNYATFYDLTDDYLRDNLEPSALLGYENDSTRRIILDPAADDIVVSVFSVVIPQLAITVGEATTHRALPTQISRRGWWARRLPQAFFLWRYSMITIWYSGFPGLPLL